MPATLLGLRAVQRMLGRARMKAFTVWRLDTPEGAQRLLGTVRALVERGTIQIDHAAIASWRRGSKMPIMEDLGSLTGPGLLWAGFWGMLFGMILLVPAGGLAFGAGAGAMAGSLSEFGVDERFVGAVRDTLVPGSSALVMLSDGTAVERILQEAGQTELALVRSDLNAQQESRLWRALVVEAPEAT